MMRCAAFAFAVLGLAACGEGQPICDNIIIHEAVSPDGALKASLFQRQCGGPTGLASQVSISSAGEAVAGKGNVMIIDTDGGHAMAQSWGGPDVNFEWTSPTDLTVTFAPFSRIISQASPVHGVTITFQSRINQ